MLRAAAAIFAAAALVLLGVGARPLFDADGELRLVWSVWGSAQPWLTPDARPLSDVAESMRANGWLYFALALAASCALGVWTARFFARHESRRASLAANLLCIGAWAAALQPGVALFVATRDPTGAEHYLDLEDQFRALGAGLLTIAALLWLAPRSRGEARPVAGESTDGGAAASWSSRTRLSLLGAMLVAGLVPQAIAHFGLDRDALTNDERAYLFQARLFADGEIAYDAGATADFFPARQVVRADDKLFSKYPPAHSALLAIGGAIGWPELVPRILAMLSVALTFALARKAGLAQPIWAAWLFALSPLFLGIESLWLSHSTSLPLTLLFAWCALEAADLASERPKRALTIACCGGLAWSIAFAARPVTAIAVAVPLVALLAIERPRGGIRLAAATAIGALPGVIALFAMNRALTGSFTEFAYEFYAKSVSPGDRFGNVTIGQAIQNTGFNVSRLSTWLCGLAPGLLLPAIALGFGPKLRRQWILWSILASLIGFYAFHPFQGIPWVGPLYASEGLPMLAVLAAHGLATITPALGRRSRWIVCAAIVLASARLLANHVAQADVELAARREPARAAREAGVERGIVFVRLSTAAAAKKISLLPPDEGDALVFARDLGARNQELMSARGETRAWLYDPSSKRLVRWP